jgi:indole-3-glycerol phosphate synthase
VSAGALEAILESCRRRLRETRRRVHRADRLNVIAEFKPASPSRGPIRPGADVEEIARRYEAEGAAAMSVLTEPEFFGSSVEHLEKARRACGLALLRKDFVLHPYQVDESRAAGADAVLAVVAALDGSALRDIVEAAHGRGMAALVEVHDERELERALVVEARLVGLNQRDLRDLSLDRDRATRLLPLVPGEVASVIESGLDDREQLLRLREAGADAFLIGTLLMETDDPGRALARIVHGEEREPSK